MDFDFYRNFITVAETGNLTRAAKKLSLAQPALSAQIKKLEQYYGASLIKTARGQRQLLLTEAGTTFLERARQICSNEEALFLNMQTFTKPASGTLRFSLSPAKNIFFIEKYLAPFAKNYPEINYEVREEAVSEQITSIENSISDFAFANAPLPAPQLFACERTRKEYFYAVYHKQNFKFAPNITIKELKDLPLCCNFGSYSLLRKVCKQHGFTPQIRFMATSNPSAIAFAKHNNGIAIVSASNNSEFSSPLMASKFLEPDLYFEQTLFWSLKNQLSPAAQLFLDFYRQQIKLYKE